MKRLSKKAKLNRDNEIANFIFEEIKGYLDAFPEELIRYMKYLMKLRQLTVDDLIEDLQSEKWTSEALLKSTFKQAQGVYDATVDRFYSDTLEDARKNDPTNPDSPARILINDYIENLENYGIDITTILDQKILDALK